MKFSLSKITSICVLFALCSCSGNSGKNKNSETTKVKAFDTSDMHTHLQSCQDFYKYSIGRWQEENPVPSTESRWMSFNILDKKNREKIQDILEETSKIKDAEKGSPKQQIRDFYASALDSSKRVEIGMKPIQGILEKIDAISSLGEVHKTIAAYRPLGLGGPYSFYVGRDRKNSDSYIVSASQSGLSLPDRDYYLKEDEKSVDIQKAYQKHVNTIFALAGMDKTSAGERIFNLEKQIAEISWTRTDLRVPELTYNKMKAKDWDAKLENIPVMQLLESWEMNKGEEMIVSTPSYFQKLDELMGQIEIEDWKAYLTWKILNSYASHLGDDFVEANFNFYAAKLSGRKEMRPKKERLMRVVDGQMGEQLGKLFVEKHFSEDSKKYMSEMIENLRSAYKESIENLTWMSDETKIKAKKKLESFTYKVGYPNKWKDYSSINISADSYLQNVLNIRKFGFENMVNRLGKPVDKDEWFMKPHMVNAYYSPSNNEIVFPAGILQPPFFHPDFDDAINYGGIGGVIGHEFTHGFDDQGSKYDWDGNLNNWWTEEDRARFDKLTNALAEQYSSYEAIPGKFVNGKMTLGENIADLGGVTLAYAALEKHLGENTPEPIDGFTWQQRFFLGWANVWKGNITETELEKRLLTDYHSPAHFRVIGPLSNVPEFENAFGCQDGEMIKSDTAKIKIW